MNFTWWCSAQSTPWTWTWQPYPGVWLLVAVVAVSYAWASARSASPRTVGQGITFGAGVLLLWTALDWPVGPLGAGYLASVHTAQYLVLGLIAPGLLLRGTPPWMLRDLLRAPALLGFVRAITRPLIAFLIFNVVMVTTHLPTVVDTLKTTQTGSFVIDMMWLFGGFVLWLPILGPLPELRPVPLPGRIVFCIANVFIPTVPASFLTFAEYPIYATYELAPRVTGLSAVQDQQIAGLTMKVGGGIILFGIASVLFFQWYARQEAESISGISS